MAMLPAGLATGQLPAARPPWPSGAGKDWPSSENTQDIGGVLRSDKFSYTGTQILSDRNMISLNFSPVIRSLFLTRMRPSLEKILSAGVLVA